MSGAARMYEDPATCAIMKKDYDENRLLQKAPLGHSFTKHMDRHAALHAARYIDSLRCLQVSLKTNRRIKRKHHTKVDLPHICAAGGKPSTKLPPRELVEQLVLTYTIQTPMDKHWRQHNNKINYENNCFCCPPLGEKYVP